MMVEIARFVFVAIIVIVTMIVRGEKFDLATFMVGGFCYGAFHLIGGLDP